MIGESSLVVVVVGDHDPRNPTHPATELALGHAAANLGIGVEPIWMATDTITADVAAGLTGVDAMIMAPGTPYRSEAGALAAAQVARAGAVPVLGTCGGMQHLVLEIARTGLGVDGAAHAEVDPSAADPWVAPLACPLVGTTDEVTLTPGTIAADLYRRPSSVESFACSFGIAPAHLADLTACGVVISGVDRSGDPRIIELPGHPFYVGTLFLPQMATSLIAPHPLLLGLLAAAMARSGS
ncbi:MAG: glutamine amidotransferase-related protein [Acidimicrobiales bacterium]